jgi:CHASE3 domain sensor protein
LTLSALAVAVLSSAAVFVLNTEQIITHRRAEARRYEERVRAVDRALSEVRAGQQAYVAAGQNADVWVPKVAALVAEAAREADELRSLAATGDARASLMEASAALVELGNVDRRAVGYLKNGQQVMAADIVYSDGGQIVTLAANLVDASRALEQQGADVAEREGRRQQGYAVGSAGLVGAATLLILGLAGAGHRRQEAQPVPAPAPIEEEEFARVIQNDIQNDIPRHSAPTLKAAAEICTELGCVNDQADLVTLLGRAAGLMDASGIIIWLGGPDGGDLRPALAHGYSSQALARMPAVPRSAGNAAAKAYRSGALQIVLARPGASDGALVSPLLTPEGCIGALSAEIIGRGETSDTTQALASLFAAQLASVLSPQVAALADDHADQIASA